jgi:hypothetical protein
VTPRVPLADPLPLPSPPGWLWALLQLTFLLHLVAMNLVLGGSLLALHWRFARRLEEAPLRSRLLAVWDRALPVAITATVTLGIAPLLFVQVLFGRVFFTSSILMGWYWLALVPLVIAGYAAAYRLAFRVPAPSARWLSAAVAVAFAGAAFVQVTNATRVLRPETFAAVYAADPRGLALGLDDPTFWPRYLHLLLGAVAMAALAVAVLGACRRSSDPELARFALRRGTTLFAVATAANLFVGMLLLIALPKPLLLRLVGGDARSMTQLALGILLATALAGASLLALGARRPGAALAAVSGLLLATLGLMLLLRDDLRRLALRQAGVETPSWVATQWGPFLVFLVSLLAAAAAIGWMVRALARGAASAAPEEGR